MANTSSFLRLADSPLFSLDVTKFCGKPFLFWYRRPIFCYGTGGIKGANYNNCLCRYDSLFLGGGYVTSQTIIPLVLMYVGHSEGWRGLRAEGWSWEFLPSYTWMAYTYSVALSQSLFSFNPYLVLLLGIYCMNCSWPVKWIRDSFTQMFWSGT